MVSKTGTRRVRGMATLAAVAVIAITATSACPGSSSSSNLSSSSAAGGGNPLAPSSSGTVVVGSANFPEDELLAEIYVLALQGKGVKVTPKLNIGAREVYYPQIEKGAISIIPEYNGTLLTVEVNAKSTAKTTAAGDAALSAGLPSRLEVLNPASAHDS